MSLTRLAIERPLTILMAILALVLMGGVAYTYLRVDRLPPVSIPTITVIIQYPQASAQDVEQLVAEPVENALAGIAGVVTIQSTSSEGRMRAQVQLAPGTDTNVATLEVQRRIASIQARLPIDILAPSIQKADVNAFPILNIALTGAPLDQLYDSAVNTLQPKLQSVAGVASVTVSGGLQREIQVQVDYAKLAAYNLSVAQISSALTAANLTTTVGSLDQGAQLLNIRSVGKFDSAGQLGKLVISQTTTGGPVFLSDLATIQEGYKDVRQVQRLNGQDSVGLIIVKASDANEIVTANGVKDALKQLLPALPAGSSIQIRNDTSLFTRASVDAVQHDILLAVGLVALVTLLFLHSFRNALIVLLSVPTSMISTLLIMYLMGFSLNLMTLMALALLVGILVDASIVVIENIHRHLALGKEPRQAAAEGRSEIALATVAIAAADIVVYVPIAFMSGFVGQLFLQYGLTVVVATIFSLLISFTLTPMLASRWLRDESGSGDEALWSRAGRWWDRGFAGLQAAVGWLVPLAVRSRWLVVLASVVLVAVTSGLVQQRVVGLEYVPGEDNSNFNVNLTTPPGTTLAVVDTAARQMEAALQQMPEAVSVFATVSAAGAGGGAGGQAQFTVQVVPKTQRSRSVFEMANEARRIGAQIPGVRVSASVQTSLPGGGGSGNLDVDVSGPDLDTLLQVVDQLEQAASQVPGLVDVRNNNLPGTPELRAVLDPARMAQLNVTTTQVTQALRTSLGGTVVTQLRPDGKPQKDITVVAAAADRTDLNKLASIPVRGNLGAVGGGAAGTTSAPVVTLGQVATLSYGTGPVQIQRTDRQQTMTVSGTAFGRPLGDVATDLQAALKQVPVPAGYVVKPGNQVNQFNTTIASLGQALGLSVVLEYMLLVALYQSWLQPLVLMLSVPLGLVGSILGLWVTQNTINMYSIIGLIMAFGLVAKSGILLLDFVNKLRAEGIGRTEALAEAARVRLRPILMTSCTMAFGMLPLALKSEAGAESRAPMAVVVIGAIITSTALALFVIPAVYTLFDDLSTATARLRLRRPSIAMPTRRVPAEAVPVQGVPAMAHNGTNGYPARLPGPAAPAATLVEPRRGMPEP